MQDPFALDGPEKSPFDNSATRNEVVGRLEGRESPRDVNLRPAEDLDASCGTCSHYEMKGAPASPCMKVATEVKAQQVCDIFEPEAMGQGPEGLPMADLLGTAPDEMTM